MSVPAASESSIESTAGSGSYSMCTALSAASARSGSSCASSRIGSSAWFTNSETSSGWSSSMSATTFSPGMSRWSQIVTPFQSKAGSSVTRVTRPRAMVERTVRPCSTPEILRSSRYSARPVTLSGASRRGTGRPTEAGSVSLRRVVTSRGVVRGLAMAAL